MNILMFDWKIFGKKDIIYAFEKIGHNVTSVETELVMERFSKRFDCMFEELITKKEYQLVFTINYSVVVSNCCNRNNIKYACVIYDSPLVSLYSYTITNKCNYIFIFDSALYNELKQGGINTVYYMPLAVNTDRLDNMENTQTIKKIFECDVSFLGSMYNEKYTFYDRLKGMSDYTSGYLEGLMQAQINVYGDYFMEKLLKGRVLDELENIMPYTPNKDGIETPQYIYANYFLARKLAEIERYEILLKISSKYKTNLYTHNKTPDLPDINNMGSIDYYTNMPYAFRFSKINLNITLRSIRSGIPLRAMDIMGAGGFLLTNYQEDFLKHFVPGEDYVYYESIADCLTKCDYYLSHDEERKQIAQNGHDKVKKYHNYPLRLSQILEIVFAQENSKLN